MHKSHELLLNFARRESRHKHTSPCAHDHEGGSGSTSMLHGTPRHTQHDPTRSSEDRASSKRHATTDNTRFVKREASSLRAFRSSARGRDYDATDRFAAFTAQGSRRCILLACPCVVATLYRLYCTPEPDLNEARRCR